MTIIYGIKNCDTIKKAINWLQQHDIPFEFHDYRKDGLAEDWLVTVEQTLGWQQLINKRGTTYRQLSEQQKQTLDQPQAIALLQQYPAMIKRPLLLHNGKHYLGFKADQYQQIFADVLP